MFYVDKPQKNNLLKTSKTNYIHIRPHAQDSNDIDIGYYQHSKNKIKISWQSFWFNKDYIEKILKN